MQQSIGLWQLNVMKSICKAKPRVSACDLPYRTSPSSEFISGSNWGSIHSSFLWLVGHPTVPDSFPSPSLPLHVPRAYAPQHPAKRLRALQRVLPICGWCCRLNTTRTSVRFAGSIRRSLHSPHHVRQVLRGEYPCRGAICKQLHLEWDRKRAVRH